MTALITTSIALLDRQFGRAGVRVAINATLAVASARDMGQGIRGCRSLGRVVEVPI